MMRIGRFTPSRAWANSGLLLGALLVCSPLSAQEQAEADWSQERQTILSDDTTPDQVIQFFTLFSADPEMSETLIPIIAELTAPGPVIEGWETTGIDILEALGAEEGGLSGNLLRESDPEVEAIIDLSGSPASEFVGFRSYALRPEISEVSAERVFSSFSPGIWFETAHQRTMRGNALCYSGYVAVTLHSARPITELSEYDLLLTLTMFASVDRLSSLELCVVYDTAENGQYSSRSFLSDGTSLPMLDAAATNAELIKRELLESILASPR